MSTDKLPATQQVCELFDVTVITDMEEPLGSLINGEESTLEPVPVYAIGSRGELGAGLRPFQLSPYFRTPQELEEWCERNLPALLDSANREELPDATNWK